MVHFDSAGKITQIRLYWDQGALLKQIDVIGARSRNWPIRDSKEQARLISSAAAAAQPDSEPSSRRSTTSRGPDDVSIASRSRGSTNNAMNDPHASLSLFENRKVSDNDSYASQPIAARVQSAKPPPREYSELFVGEGSGSPSPSPQKIPTKSGGGKNYKASRLFEEDDEEIALLATMPRLRKLIVRLTPLRVYSRKENILKVPSVVSLRKHVRGLEELVICGPLENCEDVLRAELMGSREVSGVP